MFRFNSGIFRIFEISDWTNDTKLEPIRLELGIQILVPICDIGIQPIHVSFFTNNSNIWIYVMKLLVKNLDSKYDGIFYRKYDNARDRFQLVSLKHKKHT